MDHYVNLLKLRMGRYPAVNVEVGFEVLAEVCAYYFKKNEAIAYIAGSKINTTEELDQTNAVYISDLRDERDTLSILLVRGDPGRAIPAFVNPKTRKVTVITTNEPGSVPGASCHMVISKKEIASGTDQGRHRAAMERTRGLGRALARDFLGVLLARFAEEFPERFVAEKKRKSKKEKPETIEYRPTLRLHPHKNASLKSDLESGRIGGFKLVRGRADFQGEANTPKIQSVDVKLHAVITPTKNVSGVSKLIRHVQNSIELISFRDFQLELVDEDGEAIANTRSIPVDNLGDGDMRYCKTVPMTGIGKNIAECYAKFHDPILNFSKKTVSSDKNWQ